MKRADGTIADGRQTDPFDTCTRAIIMSLGTIIVMKKSAITIATLLALAALAPTLMTPAFAHQRQLYTIGDKDYLIVIGSLNEPIFVDDKTGVDLRVLNADPNDLMNSSASGATPVEGLERTLKVELSAGNQKKELPLEPVFRDPGHYSAAFYPTVQTTYNYRIFGTINDTPVNLTFTCTPAGEAGAQPDNTEVQISEGVVRKGITGGYGCPESRSEVGFPESFMSNNEMSSTLRQIQSDVSAIKSSVGADPSGSDGLTYAAIGLGIAGIAIGAVAISRRK